VIDWENTKVVDRESDKAGRLKREALWIRKTDNINQDEESYQLSHEWDKLLHTDERYRKSVLMKPVCPIPRLDFSALHLQSIINMVTS